MLSIIIIILKIVLVVLSEENCCLPLLGMLANKIATHNMECQDQRKTKMVSALRKHAAFLCSYQATGWVRSQSSTIRR